MELNFDCCACGQHYVFEVGQLTFTAPGYILRYIRYAATTLWGTFGAPRVFLRVKLAEPVA